MSQTIIISFAEKLDRNPWWGRLIGVVLAGAVSFVAYQAMDRELPWVRLSGTIAPVHAGDNLKVEWETTPLKRKCPGTLQVELFSGRQMWPIKLTRPVGTTRQFLGQTSYMPPSWPVFSDVPPGTAVYRVTSYYYCTKIQEWLDWPVYQVGPDIRFQVLPRSK
jgi:hypothetical protein